MYILRCDVSRFRTYAKLDKQNKRTPSKEGVTLWGIYGNITFQAKAKQVRHLFQALLGSQHLHSVSGLPVFSRGFVVVL